MGGRIAFRRRLQPSVRADLIPMIDIVFQLVVFFMVTSTMSQLPGIEIEMPEASTAQTVEIQNIVISIGEDDSLFLNDEGVSIRALEKALRKVPAEERKEQSVILRGDESASLGRFVTVLDMLRKNGFDNYAVPVTVSELKDK